MYSVGLTGRVGSGKSTVAAYFKSLNIDVFSADEIARSLSLSGEPAYQAIIDYFGLSIVEPDGKLNRLLLREHIFNHPKKRLWLENLMHPLIRFELEKKRLASRSPYCILEIPLLKSKQDYPYLSRVLVVVSDINSQRNRIMHRDHCSEEQADAIINSQPPLAEYQALADDTVKNEGSVEDLQHQILTLHQEYLYAASLP